MPNEVNFDKLLNECLFCKFKNIRLYDIDYLNRTIYKCYMCGIKFLNPQYSDEYLKKYYSKYINVEPDFNSNWNEAMRETHNFYISLAERFCKIGNFLSVGCGEGFELVVAKERGWNVEGYDIDSLIVSELSKKLKIKILSGNFKTLKYPLEHFDCVYFHHVLEHIKNPMDYLNKVKSILKPTGVICIILPNINSVSNIIKYFLGKIGLKKRGKHYDTTHHIVYYSPPTLKKILEKYCNFQVLLIRNGYYVIPGHSKFQQFIRKLLIKNIIVRNVREVFIFDSTFLIIAQKLIMNDSK